MFVSFYKNYKWKTLIEKGIDQIVRLKLSLRHMKIDSQPFANNFKPENLYWLENREGQSEMIKYLQVFTNFKPLILSLSNFSSAAYMVPLPRD